MKKVLALLIVAVILSATACTPNTTSDIPHPTTASTPSPTVEPQPSPMPEPAMAICMGYYDHPIHRMLQLGFLDRCEELGYTDISIIGYETGDQQLQFEAAEAWAETVEGRPAAILLFNGDHNSDELAAKLKNMGIYVGVPHYTISVDDIPYGEEGFEVPEGYTFQYSVDYSTVGSTIMDNFAPKLHGRKGTLLASVSTKSGYSHHLTGFMMRFNELKEEGEYDLSGIKIADVYIDGGLVETALELASGKIKEYPDLIAVFGGARVSGEAWPLALQKAGYEPGEILFATLYANEANIESFNNGWIDILSNEQIYDDGYQCADYFHKLFMGEDVPICGYTYASYITRENANITIPEFNNLYSRTTDDEYFAKFKRVYTE